MCYSNRPINNSNADHPQSPRLSITHPPFHTSALSKQKNSSSSLAAILLSFLSANFFFYPPSEPDFFFLPYPQRRARSFVRGCRRLNDRSTLLATLFADRSAGLVLVFTYPRERGQLDGVPRAAEEDRESFGCHHEEACVSRDVTRVTEDSFPESCSHTSVCAQIFPSSSVLSAKQDAAYRRVLLSDLKHTFRYTEIKGKRDELRDVNLAAF